MSTAVLISIRPKWCKLIASGKKTIEVRKTRPNLETPFKCYIYCTKPSKAYQTICGCMVLNSDELFRHPREGIKYGDSIELMAEDDYTKDNFLNGKVIGEFVCDSIYRIINVGNAFKVGQSAAETNNVARASCLDFGDMHDYLGHKGGYGWHISKLKLYFKPKPLIEFRKPNEDIIGWNGEITRPPQSWRYVEEVQN